MGKSVFIIIALLLLAVSVPLLSGCDEDYLLRYFERTEDQGGWGNETAETDDLLTKVKGIYERFNATLSDALFIPSRVVHDYNLRTIDRAVELFQLVEGMEPRGIGTAGEAGTLVGEGYLKSNPPIPFGLRTQEGEWSQYILKGNPLRTWPVGDWGGYRGETP